MISQTDRLHQVQERIEAAARRVGRPAGDIQLMAVTKTVPLERITPFLKAGVRLIGENRVQEALTKYSMPSPLGGEGPGEGFSRPKLHLIGQLQSNKVKKAVGLFDVIQSLDRLDLAKDIDRHARELGKKQSCLIEVKISQESTKSGLPPEQLEEFLSQLKAFPNLEVKGLMGIAPVMETAEESRPYFARLHKLFEKSKLEILSMGMSSDFDVAIEEGSTMVRLGTVLFGKR